MGPRPINSFISLQLALPNGRAEEIKRIEGPCGIDGDWLVGLVVFDCGLMGLAQPNAPQREDKPTKTNQLTRPTNQINQIN